MRYAKKFIALLLLVTILLEEGLWQRSLESDATIISKEVEWNIQCLNAEMSYEDSKNLSRVKVAVLDSGLDTDKDIPYVERKDFLGDSELNMMYQDLTGHGTAVAGLICASENDDRITGIAAAGNDGHAEEDESTIEYPVAYDEVIAVGGTGTEKEEL